MKSTLISEKSPEIILINKLDNTSSIEQKTEINQQIRKMLPEANNSIIIYAAITMHHDLSFRELKKRIEGNYFNDLEELFDLMEQMYPNYHGRAHNRVFHLAWKRAILISKSSPTLKIVNIVKEYGETIHILGDDLSIIDDILKDRDDLDEIANTLLSLGLKPEELSLTLKNRFY